MLVVYEPSMLYSWPWYPHPMAVCSKLQTSSLGNSYVHGNVVIQYTGTISSRELKLAFLLKFHWDKEVNSLNSYVTGNKLKRVLNRMMIILCNVRVF